jgi:hypothetical protein
LSSEKHNSELGKMEDSKKKGRKTRRRKNKADEGKIGEE